MQSVDNPIILFGDANFRNQNVNFGIKLDDRRKHIYIIGKSGMGKTELQKNIAVQDIMSSRGLAVIDAHGELSDELLDYVPEHRIKDVIYFNPSDIEHPLAFNVLEDVGFDKRHLVADGIMAVFKKIWIDSWSARMEYILNYTILALLEAPGSTLLGINRVLAEKEYRKWVVGHVTDPEVKAFWTQEFAKYTDKFASEATASIQNKVGQFAANALIRNIIGQPKSSFDIREAMDQGKILLINLAKGRVGEDASNLLGNLIITKIQLGAMARIDLAKNERKDFMLMVDEFQNFATASFANILSEARKFKLSLVVAHQYVSQMSDEVRDAVFGNVGTIISFRVGAEDAEHLEKEFAPEFMATDIVNLGFRQIYLKLMVDGVTSRAFSARTMDTIPLPDRTYRQEVIEMSRQLYSHKRKEVEGAISQWREPMEGARREGQSEDRPQGDDRRPPRRSDERPRFDDRPRYDSPMQDRPQRVETRRDDRPRRPLNPRPKIVEHPPIKAEVSLGVLNTEPPKFTKKEKLKDEIRGAKREVNKEELKNILNQVLHSEEKDDLEKGEE